MESQSTSFSPLDEQHGPRTSSPSSESSMSLSQHQSQLRHRQTSIIIRKDLKIRVAEFLSSITTPKIEAEKTKFEFPLVDIKSRVRYFEAEIQKVNAAVRKLRRQVSITFLSKEKRKLKKEKELRSTENTSSLNIFPDEGQGHDFPTNEFIDDFSEDFFEESEISPERLIYHASQFQIFDLEDSYDEEEEEEEEEIICPMNSETSVNGYDDDSTLVNESSVNHNQTLPIRPMTRTNGSLNNLKSLKNVKALLENLNRKWELRMQSEQQRLEENNGLPGSNQNPPMRKTSTENLYQLKKVLALLDLLNEKYNGNDDTETAEAELRHVEVEAQNVDNQNEASGLIQKNESIDKLQQLKKVALLLEELHQKCEKDESNHNEGEEITGDGPTTHLPPPSPNNENLETNFVEFPIVPDEMNNWVQNSEAPDLSSQISENNSLSEGADVSSMTLGQ